MWAQNDNVALAGQAGWAGVGLLGLVLGWLLFMHLPARTKREKEMIDQFIAVLAAERTANDLRDREFRLALTEALKKTP